MYSNEAKDSSSTEFSSTEIALTDSSIDSSISTDLPISADLPVSTDLPTSTDLPVSSDIDSIKYGLQKYSLDPFECRDIDYDRFLVNLPNLLSSYKGLSFYYKGGFVYLEPGNLSCKEFIESVRFILKELRFIESKGYLNTTDLSKLPIIKDFIGVLTVNSGINSSVIPNKYISRPFDWYK